MAKPFIKWAGGKSQLLPDIRKKYPEGLGRTITKYCEPFVGGGSVLFDVLSNSTVCEILINDINIDLMNAYTCIKLNPSELLAGLAAMQEHFWPLNAEERKECYYEKRERFNALKMQNDETANLEKAALFIFLNKTCFNGLFRVNKRGLFNVPAGAYERPLICDGNNLTAISKLLQNVTILCGDYTHCLDFADEKTFVYIDPPYRPLTVTANFTSYAVTDFNDKEQIELEQFIGNLTQKGSKIVASNSDPKNSDGHDDFFDNLYSDYTISRVAARRMINCNSKNRGRISEILISN